MKVDMSPTAIENRLKLVGELTRACLMLRRGSENNLTGTNGQIEEKLSLDKLENPRLQN